jgi:hypothetical protein
MTDQNTPGAVSPVCGDVVAAIVGRGIGSAIGVSRRRSRRRVGVPVATAIAIGGVTISSVAVGAVGRGATFDATELRRSAAIETVRSDSTVEAREMRRTTRDIARRCARSITKRRTAGARTRRRATGAETRRGTSEAWRRTRGRAELRERGTWREDGGAENHAHG